MAITEKEKLKNKILKHLERMTYSELAELGINGQQQQKILKRQPVRMFDKTIERLKGLVVK